MIPCPDTTGAIKRTGATIGGSPARANQDERCHWAGGGHAPNRALAKTLPCSPSVARTPDRLDGASRLKPSQGGTVSARPDAGEEVG